MVGMGEMTEGRKCVECLGRRFSQRYALNTFALAFLLEAHVKSFIRNTLRTRISHFLYIQNKLVRQGSHITLHFVQ